MTTITGTDGNDSLLGSGDADTFYPLLGGDTVDGLGGSDTLIVDYSAARFDPYAGASIGGGPVSTVSSNGGSFSGRISGGSAKVDFSNIEHLQATLTFWHDRFVIDAAALAFGATIWLDGGKGLDMLEVDLSAFNGVTMQADSSSITTSFGTFLNFEDFAIKLGAGADTVTTGAGTDTLTGNGGDDVLTSGGGNDILSGGTGSNIINAGAGDDAITSIGIDQVDGGTGYDRWTGDYGSMTTGVFLTRSQAAGTATLSNGTTLSGIEVIESLTTGSGNDVFVLEQSEGISIVAGAGQDRLTLTGNGFSCELTADGPGAFKGFLGYVRFTSIENLSFTSGAVADVITVDAGPLLTGATLSLNAAGGNDTLILNLIAYASISFIVAADGTLITNVPATLLNFETYRLSASNHADNIVTGAGHDIVYGNGGDDVISTGAGNDFLDGGSGADVLSGGGGNDIYFVAEANDSIVEAADGGRDEIRTGLASFSLAALAAIEDLTATSDSGQTLTGNALANVILGGAGNDTLVGGGGDDLLQGKAGNDTYIVPGGWAGILESNGWGNDIIYTTGSYTLGEPSYDEIETLAVFDENSTNAVDLIGNTYNQLLLGNAGANVLTGGWGADILDGKGGADTFRYVSGLDSTFASPDRIRNFQTGVDKIDVGALNAVSIGLSQRVDETDNSVYFLVSVADQYGYGVILRVYGTIALSDILLVSPDRSLVGTAVDRDTLLGGDGHDVLNGLGGADMMAGFRGNDVYYVDNAGDRIVEGYGQGNDTVLASTSYALGYDINVERLTAANVSATTPLTLTGNDLEQTITGNAGSNFLRGGGGNDRLVGGGGSDRLEGGPGVDVFAFEATSDSGLPALRSDGKKIMPDVITDFVQGVDKIDLGLIDAVAGTEVNDVFSFIGSGAFTRQAGQVRAVTANGATSVYADVNGDGVADLQIILAAPVTLAAGDFVL